VWQLIVLGREIACKLYRAFNGDVIKGLKRQLLGGVTRLIEGIQYEY
jgi:hypothetical protein